MGTCQPVTLVTLAASPINLAVDKSNVYWINGDSNIMPSLGVMKCAIGGCNNTQTPVAGVLWAWHDLAVDGTNVYWNSLDYAGILKCSVNGCANATNIGASASTSQGLAVDAANSMVYWIGNGMVTDDALARCSGISPCPTPTKIAYAASGHRFTWPLATDGAYVYALDYNPGTSFSILQCAMAGAGCSNLHTQMSPATVTSLVSDGVNVYWSVPAPTAGAVWACSLNGCGAGPTALAQSKDGTLDLAVDGANVYWTEKADVVKCVVSGVGCRGTPTSVAVGQRGPEHLAVDATNLYWDDKDVPTIKKLAKP